MAQTTGRFTITGTGLLNFSLGMQPTWGMFIVVSDEGESLGCVAGGNQNVAWKWNNGTTLDSDDINTACIFLPGGVSPATPILQAAFSAWTATGVQLNVTNCTGTPRVKFIGGN